MEKKEKKIGDLAKKIYLLTYSKPRYKLEISNMIYGRESKVIYPEIKKLEKYNWIKKTSRPKDADTKKAGKRSNKRQYHCANVKPLFDSILWDLEEKNISLTPPEKKSLSRYLDSKSFRAAVREMTEENGRLRSVNLNFSTVKNHLVHAATYMIFIENWMERRIIRYPLAENVGPWITPSVLSLGTSLCKKLRHLNPYTSRVIYSSFEGMWDMIWDIFGPVLKDHTRKLEKDDYKEALKKAKPVGVIRVDPDDVVVKKL